MVSNINDNIPFDLPNSWSWVRLGNISEINLGFTHTPKYQKTGIPFLSVKDISSGVLDFTNCKYVSNEEYEGAAYGCKPHKGDILFGRVGTIGCPQIVNVDFDFCIFVSLGFLRLFDFPIDRNYLCIWFDSSLFKNQVKQHVKGTAQINLNTGWLKDFLIPIPPLNEQKRISQVFLDHNKIIKSLLDNQNQIKNLVEAAKNKILDDIFNCNSSYKSYYEKEYTLGDILPYEQPGPYIVNSTEYDDSYSTPVLTPGKTFILGYTNEENGIYKVKNSKVIIFDDFTTASRLVDFDFKVKSSAMKILKSSDCDKFNIEYLYYYLKTINVINDTHKRYWISEYAPLKIRIHSYREQILIVKYINNCFTFLDNIL